MFRKSCVCARCDKSIQENEVIHRVEDLIYHLKCFTCINCNIYLHPGDEFGLKDNQIYCRDHFLEQEKQQQQSLNSHLILDDSGYHTSPNETRQSKIDDEYFLTLSPTIFPSPYYIEREHNHSKQKRLRTSFKQQQLRYLRSYFSLKHNPGLYNSLSIEFLRNFFLYSDAKDLKSLSEKTNLSKRVLQVWFQNARAKYRRSHTLSNEDRTNNSSPIEICISP